MASHITLSPQRCRPRLYYMTPVTMVSERQIHLTTVRAKSISDWMRATFVPKGWVELDYQTLAIARSFDSTCATDGLHGARVGNSDSIVSLLEDGDSPLCLLIESRVRAIRCKMHFERYALLPFTPFLWHLNTEGHAVCTWLRSNLAKIAPPLTVNYVLTPTNPVTPLKASSTQRASQLSTDVCQSLVPWTIN
jgi:hypothetical protein